MTSTPRWFPSLLLTLALLGCATTPPTPDSPPGMAAVPPGGASFDGLFGDIEVVQEGPVRSLVFLNAEGQGDVQSEMDVRHPEALLEGYTRTMFASYLAVPTPSRVLIVGLGGGSMVRFLHAFDPTVEIDAVEIDPVVVEIADRYFGVRPDAATRIHRADAFDFLAQREDRWDVIYMDAFLQPDHDVTDASGVPLRLKTRAFLAGLAARLTPTGVVVFNLVDEGDLEPHVALVRDTFHAVWRFEVPESGNTVLVASFGDLPTPTPDPHLGAQADARLQANYSIEGLCPQWVAPP